MGTSEPLAARTNALKNSFLCRQCQDALGRIEDGGFAEALLRILILLANTRQNVRQDRLTRAARMLNETSPFNTMATDVRARKIQEQQLIVEYGGEQAIETLPHLITTKKDRERALSTARRIVGDPKEMTEATHTMMKRLETLLSPSSVISAAQ